MEAHMNSMTLSSFGGLPLLRQEEQHLAIASQLASCITDRCRKYLVHHSLEEIILTRIFQSLRVQKRSEEDWMQSFLQIKYVKKTD